MKRRSLIFVLLAWTVCCAGQGFFCRVRNIAAESGLLPAHISNAQQDSVGFLWFATWNGLTRFDGHDFYTFKPIQNSQGTILSNRIYNIKIGRKGNIWCVSSDNRLYSFDTQKCLFTDVLRQIPDLTDKRVKVLTPLKSGVTWVVFHDQSCLRLAADDWQHQYHYYPTGSADLLHSRKILDVVQDDNGDEWVLTDAGAICLKRKLQVRSPFRYLRSVSGQTCLIAQNGRVALVDRRGRVQHSQLTDEPTTVNFITMAGGRIVAATDHGVCLYDAVHRSAHQLTDGAATYLFADSRQRIWVFNGTEQVQLVSLKDFSVQMLATRRITQKTTMRNPQLIFEDADRHVILKPEQGELVYYDEQLRQLLPCRFYQNEAEVGFVPNDIKKFLVDHQGNLWIFQTHEADCISFHPNYFHHQTNSTGQETRALLSDHAGRRWTADRSLGLSLVDENGNVRQYLSPTGQLQAAFTPFTRLPAYCMAEDRQHRLWVGTKGDGVYLLTPASTGWHVEHFQNRPAEAASLCNDTIYDILPDSRGRMLFGSYGGGLSIGDEKGGQWQFRQVKAVPADARIRCIVEATPGIFLLGTNNGLLTVDLRQSSRPQCFTNSFRQEDWGLKGNDIMKIVRCGNRFYVCVFGSGISEITSTNLLSSDIHFRNYLFSATATADQVKTAVSDGTHIWIASALAVVRFTPQTGNYTVFDRTNFIGDFNMSEASPMLADGRITFGTSDGLLSCSTMLAPSADNRKPIVFTGIQYQNDMNIRPLNDLQSLVVSPDERSFSLYLSSLDYDDTQGVRFRYRLEGYDAGWNYIGEHQHAVIYNNLAPGDYLLVVQTVNDEGAWEEHARSLPVSVTPRFVETVWFRLLLLVLLIAVIVGMAYAIVYLSRMRRQLQKKYSLLMTVDEFTTDIKIENTLGLQTEADEREFLKKSIAFFEANIGNRDFVIEDLARHHGMSRSAYYNKMKSITGLSPVDFIKQMRIKKALKLMDDASLSISDIAYRVGFSDPKYFSKCFKAEMGMTPTQYISSQQPT